MMGWAIAFGVFFMVLALRLSMGSFWVARRKKKYQLEKRITLADSIDELLDLKREVGSDRDLMKRIERRLDRMVNER